MATKKPRSFPLALLGDIHAQQGLERSNVLDFQTSCGARVLVKPESDRMLLPQQIGLKIQFYLLVYLQVPLTQWTELCSEKNILKIYF